MATAPMGPFIQAGQDNRHRKHVRDYAPADCYCLWLLRSGWAECRSADERRRLQAPVILLQQPRGAPRLDIPPGGDWMRLVFDVTWRPMRRGRSGRARVPAEPAPRQPMPEAIWGVALPWRIPQGLYESCHRMLGDCLAWWWRSDLGWLRANHRLGTWLTDLVADAQQRDLLDPPPDSGEGWLARAIASIQQRLEQHLDVGHLAEQAGMSATTFRRRFQAGTGLSPRAYLAHERMRRACHLLTETGKDQREVAHLCGFASPSTFSRRFREWAGASPTEWRRRQHGERRGRGRVPFRPDPTGHNDLPWS